MLSAGAQQGRRVPSLGGGREGAVEVMEDGAGVRGEWIRAG